MLNFNFPFVQTVFTDTGSPGAVQEPGHGPSEHRHCRQDAELQEDSQVGASKISELP